MTEQPVLFGENESLVGVISDPIAASGQADAPAIILLNAGMVHRVGPNRLSVRIARKLSALGWVVFRFDFSGIGDSGLRKDGVPVERSAVIETRQAMDLLTAVRGNRRFVLMGLCSGADNAFAAACDDPRVVGAVLIDGFIAAFPVGGFLLRTYGRNFFSLWSWRKLFTGRSLIFARLKAHLLLGSSNSRGHGRNGREPAEKAILEGFHALIHRGAQLLLIYSADTPAYRNYRLRLEDALRPWVSGGRLRIETFPSSDHTFSLLSHQEDLISVICGWLQGVRSSEGVGARP